MIYWSTPEQFPKNFYRNATVPSDMLVGHDSIEFCPDDLDTDSEENRKKTFKQLSSSIEMYALPWFESITTREKLYYSICKRNRKGSGGEKLKELLLEK